MSPEHCSSRFLHQLLFWLDRMDDPSVLDGSTTESGVLLSDSVAVLSRLHLGGKPLPYVDLQPRTLHIRFGLGDVQAFIRNRIGS